MRMWLNVVLDNISLLSLFNHKNLGSARDGFMVFNALLFVTAYSFYSMNK
jgi:hypothetical protein